MIPTSASKSMKLKRGKWTRGRLQVSIYLLNWDWKGSSSFKVLCVHKLRTSLNRSPHGCIIRSVLDSKIGPIQLNKNCPLDTSQKKGSRFLISSASCGPMLTHIIRCHAHIKRFSGTVLQIYNHHNRKSNNWPRKQFDMSLSTVFCSCLFYNGDLWGKCFMGCRGLYILSSRTGIQLS